MKRNLFILFASGAAYLTAWLCRDSGACGATDAPPPEAPVATEAPAGPWF
jgi:hypothetical protein